MMWRDLFCGLRVASLLACLPVCLLACTSSGGDGTGVNEGSGQSGFGGGGDGDGDGDGDGNLSGPNTPVKAADVAACGASCVSDVQAGRAALAQGDFAKALEELRCANTPEAAFGAGLAQLMLATESAGADALLEDVGLPPLDASALLGPDSVASRVGSRWNGEGQLTLSGAVSLSGELRVQQERTEWSEGVVPGSSPVVDSSASIDLDLEATDVSSDAYLNLSLWRSGSADTLGAGTFAQSYDCTTGLATGAALDLALELRHGGIDYYCNAPYSQEVTSCEPDGGSVTITAAGTAIGETASYQIESLLLECEDESEEGLSARLRVRLSATLSATTVDGDPDFSDLHPLFGGEWAAAVPEQSTVTAALQHIEALAGEVAKAACYFDLAGRGTGTVFTLPGVLYGGPDAAVSAGDAQILSAASLLALGAAQLGAAYGVDMPLRALVCDEPDEEECIDASCAASQMTCPSEQDQVSLFNQGFARVFHAGTLEAAEAVLRTGLERLSAGIDALSAESVFARTEDSEAGLQSAKQLADAVLESLERGEVTLPEIAPPVILSLKTLFDTPPQRGDIAADPLIYAEVCDPEFPDECDYDTTWNTDFWSQFLSGAVSTDWEAEHEWTGEEDALSEVLRSTQRSGIVVFH